MQQKPVPFTFQKKTYTQAEFDAFTQALLKQQEEMFNRFAQNFTRQETAPLAQTLPATSQQPPTFQHPLEGYGYSQR